MQDIEAIIFDFGGVIFNIDFHKLNTAFKNLGVHNFDKMYSQKNADPLFSDLEKGKISEAEFYTAFKKCFNSNLSDIQIKNAWNTILIDYRMEALNTLKFLKKKYKLYLLSNTNIIHHTAFHKIYQDKIGKDNFDDLFDKVYYSHQIGCRKPDKEIYEFVINDISLNPSNSLFIDDSIQNITAAAASGFKTILLHHGEKIEDHLGDLI